MLYPKKERPKARKLELPLMSPLFKLLHPQQTKAEFKKEQKEITDRGDMSSSNQSPPHRESDASLAAPKKREDRQRNMLVWEKTTSESGLPCSYLFCG